MARLYFSIPCHSNRLLTVIVILKIFKIALSITQHKFSPLSASPMAFRMYALFKIFAHSQNSYVQFWMSLFILDEYNWEMNQYTIN